MIYCIYVMMITDVVNPKSVHPVIHIGTVNTGNRAEAIVDGTQLYSIVIDSMHPLAPIR